jgi:hypothetical protein
MKTEFDEIVKARLPITHFLGFATLGLVLVSLSYVLFIPFIYWTMFGEGETASRIARQPINLFIVEWGALITAIIVCALYFFRSFKLEPKKAKSYLFIGILLILTYPFREDIGDFIFNIFQ